MADLHDDRRRFSRADGKLTLTVNGRSYEALEWSFGGFPIEEPERRFATGALIRIDGISVNGHGDGEDEPVRIRARVVRVEGDRSAAALNCLHLDDNAIRVLYRLRDGE